MVTVTVFLKNSNNTIQFEAENFKYFTSKQEDETLGQLVGYEIETPKPFVWLDVKEVAGFLVLEKVNNEQGG